MSPRARPRPTHGGARAGAGRPPSDNPRTTTIRVSPADLERWRAIAAQHGYADVYDLITVAIEQLRATADENPAR